MTKEARGNFVVWINRNKSEGDRQPHFTGRISVPHLRLDHATALWGGRDKRRKVFLSGLVTPLPMTATPADELDFVLEPPVYDIEDVVHASQHLTVKPNEIILFENPNRTAETPNRPPYYGRAIIGLDRHFVEIGAWLKRSRSNSLMFSGATSFPVPKATEPEASPESQLNTLIR